MPEYAEPPLWSEIVASILNKEIPSVAGITGLPSRDTQWVIISHRIQPASTSNLIIKSYEGTPIPVPTVEELKTKLQVPSSGGLLFYSGPGGFIGPATVRAQQMGLKVLEDSWIDKTYPDEYQKKLSPADLKIFWDHASQAFAELASGTIYVLLPDYTTLQSFFPTSVWARVEWPTLEKNANVTKVLMIFPGIAVPIKDTTHKY
ncbi:hypothetical protein H0H81_003459 [Sphagnurus paluster]|uniref:Uncharacterized protein n=1 Tax=Sphagnurus paluster TaxID=117069 RepID=A0A9P7GP26_9AGAR|nr:hypothetical protein H0H81_003459 [Sphagnurus paluster]